MDLKQVKKKLNEIGFIENPQRICPCWGGTELGVESPPRGFITDYWIGVHPWLRKH